MSVTDRTEDDIGSIVDGSDLVLARLGRWPLFHDAEVLQIELERGSRTLRMSVRAFNVTDTVDAEGHFVMADECLIRFEFRGVDSLELQGWNEQNVLSTLAIERRGEYIIVVLDPLYGVGGEFTCEHACVLDVAPI